MSYGTTTTPIKFTAKRDLIKALHSKRPAMSERDRKVKAAHAQAEKEALAKFRDEVKELSKLTYADLRERDKRRGSLYIEINIPSCPLLFVPRLDSIVARMELSSQEAFTVTRGTDLWDLLTFGEPSVSAC